MTAQARAKIRAALGNLRVARWYAAGGEKPAEARAHAVDAGMFLGIAIMEGAKTNAAAWAMTYRLAHRLARAAGGGTPGGQ
jgi:hypothetical protein